MNYIVVLFKNKKRKKIIKSFVRKNVAELYFKKLCEQSDQVKFNVEVENSLDVTYEVGLLSKTIDTQFQENTSSVYFSLSPKQRSVMSLTSQGKSAKEIALQLDLSYSYVRKELSRAYGVLIPNPVDGYDLKTAAVLKYIELMRIS
jgi:DNA-binding NarL/FixJ family response regulator